MLKFRFFKNPIVLFVLLSLWNLPNAFCGGGPFDLDSSDDEDSDVSELVSGMSSLSISPLTFSSDSDETTSLTAHSEDSHSELSHSGLNDDDTSEVPKHWLLDLDDSDSDEEIQKSETTQNLTRPASPEPEQFKHQSSPLRQRRWKSLPHNHYFMMAVTNRAIKQGQLKVVRNSSAHMYEDFDEDTFQKMSLKKTSVSQDVDLHEVDLQDELGLQEEIALQDEMNELGALQIQAIQEWFLSDDATDEGIDLILKSDPYGVPAFIDLLEKKDVKANNTLVRRLNANICEVAELSWLLAKLDAEKEKRQKQRNATASAAPSETALATKPNSELSPYLDPDL